MANKRVFEYESDGDMYGSWVNWKLKVDSYTLRGQATTARQAFRQARRALRRHRKMLRVLGEPDRG